MFIPYKYNYTKRVKDWWDFKQHNKLKNIRNEHKRWSYERKFCGEKKGQITNLQIRCRLCDKLFEEYVFNKGEYLGQNYNGI